MRTNKNVALLLGRMVFVVVAIFSMLLITTTTAFEFVPIQCAPQQTYHTSHPKLRNVHNWKHSFGTPASRSISALSASPRSKNNEEQARRRTAVDGTGRGVILQGLTLLVCIWIFSIPPEFRRSHFCVVDKCVQNRAQCYDCVTFDEWKHGIVEYYQNGGGVQFDFSVADETKAIWRKAINLD